MKLLRSQRCPCAPRARRGAALMLCFMVLIVLVLITLQIRYSTETAARVARNEETLLSMDLAIESALLQVYEDLKTDAESDSSGADAASALSGAGASGDAASQAPGGSGGGGPTDSKEDEWAHAQRTELNEIQLRVLVQDEDSKFNVLSVLTEDDEEAEKALDRLTRVIELARKGTENEIDGSSARRMATVIKEFMERRGDQTLPKPELLSDDEEEPDYGPLLSLRELVAVDAELFTEDLFREFVDESGNVVHSLGAFLTVWSSVATLDEAAAAAEEPADEAGETPDDEDDPNDPPEDDPSLDPPEDDPDDPNDPDEGEQEGEGQAGGESEPPPPGWAINVNTAPSAVLHALLDDRDVPYRFWDSVIVYRNEKDEEVEENEDPPLDEYGREIIVHKFFRSTDELAEVDGWDNTEPIVQAELRSLLKTQSQVFSIYVTARKPTGEERIGYDTREEDIEREEAQWHGLVRTVRAVVWRRALGEGEVQIVPLVRWEVIDHAPFEVLDYPEDREFR